MSPLAAAVMTPLRCISIRFGTPIPNTMPATSNVMSNSHRVKPDWRFAFMGRQCTGGPAAAGRSPDDRLWPTDERRLGQPDYGKPAHASGVPSGAAVHPRPSCVAHDHGPGCVRATGVAENDGAVGAATTVVGPKLEDVPIRRDRAVALRLVDIEQWLMRRTLRRTDVVVIDERDPAGVVASPGAVHRAPSADAHTTTGRPRLIASLRATCTASTRAFTSAVSRVSSAIPPEAWYTDPDRTLAISSVQSSSHSVKPAGLATFRLSVRSEPAEPRLSPTMVARAAATQAEPETPVAPISGVARSSTRLESSLGVRRTRGLYFASPDFSKVSYGEQEILQLLSSAGCFPDAQRIDVALVILAKPQHLSADQIIASIRCERLARVQGDGYNTLNLFCERGLLRTVEVDPARPYYDSTIQAHHHFYNVDTGELTDIPVDAITLNVKRRCRLDGAGRRRRRDPRARRPRLSVLRSRGLGLSFP